MKKQMFSLAFIFAFLAVPQVHADRGFLRTDSELVSPALKQAGSSIFRILTTHENFIAIPGTSARIQQEIEARLHVDKKLRKEKPWSVQQLEFCLRVQMNPCLYSISYNKAFSGTAFVASTDKTLWTAGHNIKEYYKALQQHDVKYNGVALKDMGKIPLFFRLEGMNGLVDFHRYYSAEENGIAYLVNDFSKYDEIALDVEDKIVHVSKDLTADIAILEMSEPLATPLKWASSTNLDDTFYIIGFPQATFASGRELYHPKGDSNGGAQYVSDGRFVSCEDLSTLADERHQDVVAQLLSFAPENSLLCSKIDAVPGNSGGPLLNEKGEVVSMVVIGWPYKNNEAPTESRNLSINLLTGSYLP